MSGMAYSSRKPSEKVCSVEDCGRPHLAKGFCGMHHARWKRTGDPLVVRNRWERGKVCSVEGCPEPHEALGFCNKHYKTYKKHGDANGAKSRIRMCNVEGCTNRVHGQGLCDNHYRLAQRNGAPDYATKKPGRVCSIDGCEGKHKGRGYCEKHYSRFMKHGDPLVSLVGEHGEGHVKPDGYRTIRVDYRNVLEHRYVMEQALGRELTEDENVHHINGDRADNRIENLELWSTRQPPGQRVTDKVEWALELLARYAPERLA